MPSPKGSWDMYFFHMGSTVPIKNWGIVPRKKGENECWIENYQLITKCLGFCHNQFPSSPETPVSVGFARLLLRG